MVYASTPAYNTGLCNRKCEPLIRCPNGTHISSTRNSCVQNDDSSPLAQLFSAPAATFSSVGGARRKSKRSSRKRKSHKGGKKSIKGTKRTRSSSGRKSKKTRKSKKSKKSTKRSKRWLRKHRLLRSNRFSRDKQASWSRRQVTLNFFSSLSRRHDRFTPCHVCCKLYWLLRQRNL